jgi:hypothetical protein
MPTSNVIITALSHGSKRCRDTPFDDGFFFMLSMFQPWSMRSSKTGRTTITIGRQRPESNA